MLGESVPMGKPRETRGSLRHGWIGYARTSLLEDRDETHEKREDEQHSSNHGNSFPATEILAQVT